MLARAMDDHLVDERGRAISLVILAVLVCTTALTIYSASRTLRLEYLLTVIYVALLTLVGILFDKLRLGVALMLILSAPPFVEYELALVELVAQNQAASIRPFVVYPVFTLVDGALVLLMLTSVAKCLLQYRTKHMLKAWPLFAVGLLQIISALLSVIRYQGTADQGVAFAGLSMTAMIVVIMLLASSSIVVGATSIGTLLGFSLGTLLFCAESLYVTFYKYGLISIGRTALTGLVPGPGATGSVLVLAIPILVNSWLTYKGRVRRFMAFASIVALTYAILTYSRATYVGILVAILMIAYLLKGRQKKRVIAVIVLTGLLMFVIISGSTSGLQQKFRAMFSDELQGKYNLGRRLVYWEHAFWLTVNNPLFGIGPKMWVPNAQALGNHVHQLYLQYAAEYGLIAFAVFSLVVATILYSFVGWKKSTLEANYRPYLGFSAAIIGFLVSQIFESTLGSWRVYSLFWTWLVILCFRPSKKHIW